MSVAALPQLTAKGIELDLSPEKFGFLRSSADIASDAGALRERMREDGYLYVPGLLDVDLLIAARRIITDGLAADGHLDPSYPAFESIARSTTKTNPIFREELVQDNAPLNEVLYSGKMMEFHRLFFGEEVRHFDFTWFRTIAPGQSKSPHCDIVYMGRGTYDVHTTWTPLGDIPLDHGVLAILEDSHKKAELSEYRARDVDTYCFDSPNAEKIRQGQMGFEWDGNLDSDAVALRNRLGGRWLSTDFHLGDVLIFTMGTVHCSFDNHSNKIRLSSDSRYQRASEPMDERWIGPNPIGHGAAGKHGKIC